MIFITIILLFFFNKYIVFKSNDEIFLISIFSEYL